MSDLDGVDGRGFFISMGKQRTTDFSTPSWAVDPFDFGGAPETTPKEDDSFLDNVGEGFEIGGKNLVAGAGKAIGEFVSQADPTNDWAANLKYDADQYRKSAPDSDGSVGQFIGQVIPSAIPTAAAVGASAVSGGLAAPLAIASIGSLGLASAGSGMYEYEDYQKRNNLEVDRGEMFKIGLAYATVEMAAERLGLNALTGKTVKTIWKGNQDTARKAGTELLSGYLEKNPKKGTQIVKNMLSAGNVEGLEELATSVSQDLIANKQFRMDKDDATFQEIAKNAGASYLAGGLMGVGIGPLSYAAQNRVDKDRRSAQGRVLLAQDKKSGDVVELVSKTDDGYKGITPQGTWKEFTTDQIGEQTSLPTEQFYNILKDRGDLSQIQEQEAKQQKEAERSASIEAFDHLRTNYFTPNEEGVEVLRQGTYKGMPVIIKAEDESNNGLVYVTNDTGTDVQLINKGEIEDLQELTEDQVYEDIVQEPFEKTMGDQFAQEIESALGPTTASPTLEPLQRGEEVSFLHPETLEQFTGVVAGLGEDEVSVELLDESGEGAEIVNVQLEAIQRTPNEINETTVSESHDLESEFDEEGNLRPQSSSKQETLVEDKPFTEHELAVTTGKKQEPVIVKKYDDGTLEVNRTGLTGKESKNLAGKLNDKYPKANYQAEDLTPDDPLAESDWRVVSRPEGSEAKEEGNEYFDLVENAVSDKELDAITDQATKAEKYTPELLDAISNKRGSVIPLSVEQDGKTLYNTEGAKGLTGKQKFNHDEQFIDENNVQALKEFKSGDQVYDVNTGNEYEVVGKSQGSNKTQVKSLGKGMTAVKEVTDEQKKYLPLNRKADDSQEATVEGQSQEQNVQESLSDTTNEQTPEEETSEGVGQLSGSGDPQGELRSADNSINELTNEDNQTGLRGKDDEVVGISDQEEAVNSNNNFTEGNESLQSSNEETTVEDDLPSQGTNLESSQGSIDQGQEQSRSKEEGSTPTQSQSNDVSEQQSQTSEGKTSDSVDDNSRREQPEGTADQSLESHEEKESSDPVPSGQTNQRSKTQEKEGNTDSDVQVNVQKVGRNSPNKTDRPEIPEKTLKEQGLSEVEAFEQVHEDIQSLAYDYKELPDQFLSHVEQLIADELKYVDKEQFIREVGKQIASEESLISKVYLRKGKQPIDSVADEIGVEVSDIVDFMTKYPGRPPKVNPKKRSLNNQYKEHTGYNINPDKLFSASVVDQVDTIEQLIKSEEERTGRKIDELVLDDDYIESHYTGFPFDPNQLEAIKTYLNESNKESSLEAAHQTDEDDQGGQKDSGSQETEVEKAIPKVESKKTKLKTKEDKLKDEIGDIWKAFGKSDTANTGVSPEQFKMAGDLLAKTTELGLVKFEQVINYLVENFGIDLARQQFDTFKAAYGAQRMLNNPDNESLDAIAQGKIEDFISEAKQTNAFELDEKIASLKAEMIQMVKDGQSLDPLYDKKNAELIKLTDEKNGLTKNVQTETVTKEVIDETKTERPKQSVSTLKAKTKAIEAKGKRIKSRQQAGAQLSLIDEVIEDIDNELRLLGHYESPKAGDHEVPTVEHEKYFKKDLVKFSKELAKQLGWQHDTDKKGKNVYANTNVAPAGGDGTIILWKPDSDHGVYISVPVQPDYQSPTDKLLIKSVMGKQGGFFSDNDGDGAILWRATTRENKYRGLQNKYADSKMSVSEFKKLILKAIGKDDGNPPASAGAMVLKPKPKAEEPTTLKPKKVKKSKVYQELETVIGDISKLEAGFHKRVGEEGDAFMPFSAEVFHLEPSYVTDQHKGEKGYRVILEQFYIQNGDLMVDPRVDIAVYPNKGEIEVLNFEQAGFPPVWEQYVEDGKVVNARKQKGTHDFLLNTWLPNLVSQNRTLIDDGTSSKESQGLDGQGTGTTSKKPSTEGVSSNDPNKNASQVSDRQGEQSTGTNDSTGSRGDGTGSSTGSDLDGPNGITREVRNKQNYVIPETYQEPDSFSQAKNFDNNISALEILVKLQEQDRTATAEEKETLFKYVGWGGLKAVLLDPYARWSRFANDAEQARVKKVYDLAKVLDPNNDLGIIDSIKKSTFNAHYTSIDIIRGVYDVLDQIGFKGGAVLEPSMGTGHFFGAMPGKMLKNSSLHGVELDTLTSMIGKALYPDAKIQNSGLQEARVEENTHDLVVSNIPFGDIKIYDKSWKGRKSVYKLAQARVHNYFVVKSIELAKPGGLVAIITSKSSLDTKGNTGIRQYMKDNTNFIGAVRLPDNAFKANAGTEVVTDVIFLQKLEPGQKGVSPAFVQTKELRIDDTLTANVNEYFVNNPNQVVGQFERGGLYRDDDITVKSDKKDFRGEISERLKEVASQVEYSKVKPIESVQEQLVKKYKGENPVKIGNLVEQDGELLRVTDFGEDGPELSSSKIGKKYSPIIKKVIGLRDSLNGLLNDELIGEGDEVLIKQRADLKKQYDRFVSKHGSLHKNQKIVLEDVDGYNLLSLEITDKSGNVTELADVFKKRTVKPYKRPSSADTAQEAVFISINEFGRVEPRRMTELLGDDWFTQSEGEVFKLPDGSYESKAEYLSGNVRKKFAEVEGKAGFSVNEEALRAVVPQDIEAEYISIPFGARWVDSHYYSNFIQELTGYGAEVIYIPGIDKFKVEKLYSPEYSTNRKSAKEIFEALLHDKTIKVYDKIKVGDTETTVFNKEATAEVDELMKKITRDWNDWVIQDRKRASQLSRTYNDMFNAVVNRTYDGSFLSFAGLKDIELRAHQKDAVYRLVQNNGGVIDHIVGAGKTFVMIGSAMEMKRLGIANKPMIIGLKSTIPHIVRDFQRAYPNAKILAPKESDFTANNRKKFLAKIATNDWDAVILSHENFTGVKPDTETMERVINDEIQLLELAVTQLKGDKSQLSKQALKGLEKRKENLQVKLSKLSDAKKDTEILHFGQLGVDHVMVDESQQFKNLAYTTTHQQVSGLGDPTGSQRSYNLLYAARYLQSLHQGDKGLTFLSGTPISNSMVEMYLILKYLRPNKLSELGIDTFDSWAKTFAEKSNELEFSVSGQVKQKERFRKFVNVPELASLYTEIADVRNDSNLKLPKPTAKGGSPDFNLIQPGENLERFNKKLIHWANNKEQSQVMNLPNLDYDPEVNKSPMLLVTDLAEKAAIDLRLLYPEAAYDPNSKLGVVSSRVAEKYKETTEHLGTQLVFMDKGKSSKHNPNFNGEKEIKRILVEEYGIPANEIALVSENSSKAKREKLFQQVNDGKVRVMIGGTQTMGTGVNAQQRIVAMHHVDIPWRPSDFEQRNGRGLRQGNEVARDFYNNEVDVNVYGIERSLDAYKFELLSIKQSFIDQVKSGATTSRVIDEGQGDDESGAGFSEFMAATTGNPVIKEKAKNDKQIQAIETSKKSFINRRGKASSSLTSLDQEITRLGNLVELKRDMVNYAESNGYDQEADFEAVVKGKTYDKPKEAGDALLKAKPLNFSNYFSSQIQAEHLKDIKPHMEANGFGVYVIKAKDGELPYYVFGRYENGQFRRLESNPLSQSPVYAGQRIKNSIQKLYTDITSQEKLIYQKGKEIVSFDKVMQEEWGRDEELNQAYTERSRIEKEIAEMQEAEKAKDQDTNLFDPLFKRTDIPEGTEGLDQTNGASHILNPFGAKKKGKVESDIKVITKGWKNAPETVVYESLLDFATSEPAYFDRWKEIAGDFNRMVDIPGFWDPVDGVVRVIADHHGNSSKSGLTSLLLHEMVGHYGLRGFVENNSHLKGTKYQTELNSLLDDVVKSFKESNEFKVIARTYVGETEGLTEIEERLVAEEFLAHRAEVGQSDTFVDRLISWVRKVFRELTGRHLRLNDAEVRQILANAKRYITVGDSVVPRSAIDPRFARNANQFDIFDQGRGKEDAPIKRDVLRGQLAIASKRMKELVKLEKQVRSKTRQQEMSILQKEIIRLSDAMSMTKNRDEATEGGQQTTLFKRTLKSDDNFYSNSLNSLATIPMEKATGDQWKSMLLKNGSSQYELEWIGFDEFIKENPKATKQQVMDFISSNKVEVVDVMKGGAEQPDFNEDIQEVKEKLAAHGYYMEQEMDGGESIRSVEDDSQVQYDDLSDDVQALVYEYETLTSGELTESQESQETQYSKYTLPGGQNYKELLLTMPEPPAKMVEKRTELSPTHALIHDSLADTWGVVTEEQGHGRSITGMYHSTKEEATREGLAVINFDAQHKQDEKAPKPFKSSHWTEPNILSHIRFNERTVDSSPVKVDDSGNQLVEISQGTWKLQDKARNTIASMDESQAQKAIKSGNYIKMSGEAIQIGRYTKIPSKVLFIEEIQSDWAQEGRKKGFIESEDSGQKIERVREDSNVWVVYFENGEFVDVPKNKARTEGQARAMVNASNSWTRHKSIEGKVPQMPFKKTGQWVDLSLKRMIRYASENGFDRIAWVTGEQSAERYALSNQIDSIGVRKMVHSRKEGLKEVSIIKDSQTIETFAIEKDGVVYAAENPTFDGKRLDEIVGKDMAEKVLSVEENLKTFSGLDLKVGGEGMKSFYNNILPKQAGKLLKKFDKTAKVEPTNILAGSSTRHSSYMEFPDGVNVYDAEGNVTTSVSSVTEAKKLIAKDKLEVDNQQLSFEITPALRQKSIQEGMPMFKRMPQVEESKSKRKEFILEQHRRYLDQFIDLKRLQDQKKAKGGLLEDSMNAYQKETLSKSRITSQQEDFKKELFHPMVDHIKSIFNKTGVKYDVVSRYLKAKHAIERNAYMREETNSGDDAIFGGLSDQEANEIIAAFEDKVSKADRDKLHEQVKGITQFTLEKQLKDGLITEKTFDSLQGMYEFYVPLRGFDSIKDDPTMFSGFKRAKGRESEAGDPIAYLMTMADTAIIQGEKNRVKQSMLEFVKANPDSKLYNVKNVWFINTGTTETDEQGVEREIWQETTDRPSRDQFEEGNVKKSYDPDKEVLRESMMTKENVTVLVNGRKVTIEFIAEGARIGQALKNMHVDKAPKFLSWMREYMAFLRTMYTQYSPEFVVRNLIRDTTAGYINIRNDYGSKTANEVGGNMIDSIGAIRRGLYGTPKNTKIDEHFEEFRTAGAMTGYTDLKSVQQHQNEIKSMVEGLKGNKFAYGKEQLEKVLKPIDDWNRTFENAIRFSAYHVLRKKGVSVDKAAVYAKDLTVNFNRKGNWSDSIGSLYLFFNASVQGSHRMLKTFVSPDKKVRNRAIMSAMVLPSLAMGLATIARIGGGKDEDDEYYYDKLSEHTRSHNFILPNFLTSKEGDFIKIPLPYGFNFFTNLGETGLRVALGKDSATHGLAHVAGSAFGSFSPLGSPNIADDDAEFIEEVGRFAPTVMQPYLDLVFNKNFAGYPIYREPFIKGQAEQPDSQMYFSNINPIFKGITSGLNSMTGGDEVTAGWLDMNPEHLEHVFGTFTGGAGTFVNNSATTLLMAMDGKNPFSSEEDRFKKVPFLRNYVTTPSDFYSRRVFQENYSEIQEDKTLHKRYLNLGEKEKAKGYKTSNSKSFKMLSYANTIKKRVENIKKRIKTLEQMPSSPVVDQKIEGLKAKEQQLYIQFNNKYKNFNGESGLKLSDIIGN